jgi:ketosteroid isomerase-like protein
VSPDLPELLAAYFRAVNVRDVAAMLDCFSADASIKDEGQEHHGAEAIREWMRAVVAKYDFTVEPMHVVESAGKQVVTGTISGNFPGSPVSVRHAFTIEGQRIARLEIG